MVGILRQVNVHQALRVERSPADTESDLRKWKTVICGPMNYLN